MLICHLKLIIKLNPDNTWICEYIAVHVYVCMYVCMYMFP